MEANFQWKVMIILKAYWFQLREFSNENSLGTKIDFEFSCEKSLCSINDLKKVSEISLFICCSRTFPHIFWTKICQVRICRDEFFSAVISQCVSSTTNSCSWSNRSFCCVRHFFFFVGNSRLNYRITESIFDTTLFTLTLSCHACLPVSSPFWWFSNSTPSTGVRSLSLSLTSCWSSKMMSGKGDKPEINNTMIKYWYVAHISKQPELNTSYIFLLIQRKEK